MHCPAIVIAAWNRPKSLQRLLSSLERAHYDGEDISLVISLDGEGSKEVARIAKKFRWPHGPKEVICEPIHLGLKLHILRCGDLSQDYGSIILLEDDLVVSPWFYHYAEHALGAYQADDRIAGISLYSHRMMESNAFYPFDPMCGTHGVYFIQYAVSWGQAWTAIQWQLFREWLSQNLSASNGIASYLDRWPDDSWKKEFIRYLMATDRYFACPGTSYTTNFADAGTHFPEDSSVFQVPLALEEPNPIAIGSDFRPLDPGNESYDACFEPKVEWLKAMVPELQEYDLEIDLTGQKEPENIRAEYVLTSRPVGGRLRSWGMRMRPLWQNLYFGVEGEELSLCRKEDVLPLSEKDRLEMYIRLHRFFYPVPKLRSQVFYEFLRGIGMMKK